MGGDAEQFDMWEPTDREQRIRVLLRRAAQREGVSELATGLRMDERTLRNQLDRRKREDKQGSYWKLSEDAVIRLLEQRRLREEILALFQEEILDSEAVEPEDALRDIHAMAMQGVFGNDARERVEALLRKVKRGRKREVSR